MADALLSNPSDHTEVLKSAVHSNPPVSTTITNDAPVSTEATTIGKQGRLITASLH